MATRTHEGTADGDRRTPHSSHARLGRGPCLTSPLPKQTLTLSEVLRPPRMAENLAKTPRSRSRMMTSELLPPDLWPKRPILREVPPALATSPTTQDPGKAAPLNPGTQPREGAEGQINNNEFAGHTAMLAVTPNGLTTGQTSTLAAWYAYSVPTRSERYGCHCANSTCGGGTHPTTRCGECWNDVVLQTTCCR